MENVKKIIKEFKAELERIYGEKLKSVILYGSWARNEATENSDIDLVVVFKGDIIQGKEIDRMIDSITEINLKYNILISVYPVSEENYLTIKSPLLLNIRQEGIAA